MLKNKFVRIFFSLSYYIPNYTCMFTSKNCDPPNILFCSLLNLSVDIPVHFLQLIVTSLRSSMFFLCTDMIASNTKQIEFEPPVTCSCLFGGL